MIEKAVIPAAGFGTRFLPATKAQPKEMLPVVDTPAIQMVVEEAVKSGIVDILIITGKGKRAIEDHFDRHPELERELAKKGAKKILQHIEEISNLAAFHYVRQKELRGLGNAIYESRFHVEGEPFLVLLGDTLIASNPPCSRQLMEIYNKFKCTIIGVEEVEEHKVKRYGIVKGKRIEENIFEVEDLIEKPSPAEAPSRLAIGGRYVLLPEIFSYIEKTPPGVGKEIQITDALKLMRRDGHRILAYKFEGKRYDIGNILDYLETVVDFALKREDIGDKFRKILRSKLL